MEGERNQRSERVAPCGEVELFALLHPFILIRFKRFSARRFRPDFPVAQTENSEI